MKRYRRPEAARYLREVHDIPFEAKTLANRNAAGLPPKPDYLGTIPFYRQEVLDAFAETAFAEESPVTATRRRHAELEHARREQEVPQPRTEHRRHDLADPLSAA
jgi:hypothetical protein